MELLTYILRRKKRHNACLVAASVFLFFILYSAPHRVHHFFEQASIAAARAESQSRHHHSATDPRGQDHELPQPKQADCATQLTAQNTLFASPPLIDFVFREFATGQSERKAAVSVTAFNPAPLSQRAPPFS